MDIHTVILTKSSYVDTLFLWSFSGDRRWYVGNLTVDTRWIGLPLFLDSKEHNERYCTNGNDPTTDTQYHEKRKRILFDLKMFPIIGLIRG